MGTEERDTVIGGRYLDRLEKRAGEWRIANRVMLYDWFQDFGVSVDWSQGVMGMPFSADHYTGRAVGDYSEDVLWQANVQSVARGVVGERAIQPQDSASGPWSTS